jgi:hypothetical protein
VVVGVLAFLAPTSALTIDGTPSSQLTRPVAITSGLNSSQQLDLGVVTMGTNGTLQLTLQNDLNAAISNLAVSIVPATLSVAGSTLVQSLGALSGGPSATITIAVPATEGALSGTLSITGTVLGSPFVVTAPVGGRATAWAFNAGTSALALSSLFIGTGGGGFNSATSVDLVSNISQAVDNFISGTAIGSLQITGGASAVNVLGLVSTGPLPIQTTYTGSGQDTLTSPSIAGETIVVSPSGAGSGTLTGYGGTPTPDAHGLTLGGQACRERRRV